MDIKYAMISSGKYVINMCSPEDLNEELRDGMYATECINKERNLYVEYDYDLYCPIDMSDWQFIVKHDKDGNLDTLTDDDIKYIKKYHWMVFQVYCWQTFETILNFIKWGCEPDFSKRVDDDPNVAEIENGYRILYERYKDYR